MEHVLQGINKALLFYLDAITVIAPKLNTHLHQLEPMSQ